jgi:anthranilate synthase/aminodeoxychorismate synthase-like glutamine amidotransferase
MLLVIDNYDSFTYNLVHYFQILRQRVQVFYHDKISIDEIRSLAPSHIVISPGPKGPQDAGISVDVIKNFYQHLPILGICLGHQSIAYALNGKITHAPRVVHGTTSLIYHNNQRLFRGITRPFRAVRYHSLAVDNASLPACFHIDAWADKTIMAISHRQYPLYGLQFHPEAILSENGLDLLNNFLK